MHQNKALEISFRSEQSVKTVKLTVRSNAGMPAEEEVSHMQRTDRHGACLILTKQSVSATDNNICLQVPLIN